MRILVTDGNEAIRVETHDRPDPNRASFSERFVRLERLETSVFDTVTILGPGALGVFGVQSFCVNGVRDAIFTGMREE